jgi:uncharacterized membrane protein YoaT (DUF817 family)
VVLSVRDRVSDLLVVVVLLGAAIACISLTYASTWVCLGWMSVLMMVTIWRWHAPRDVVLGLTGVLCGPTMEVLATHSGLWTYAHPDVSTLPLWIVPMWWMFPVSVVCLVRAVIGNAPSGGNLRVGACLILVETPWLCVLGNTHPRVAFVGTLAMLAVVLRRSTVADLTTLFWCGVIGPAVEMIPVGMGAWSYPQTPLAGLPLWLPTGYGVFGWAIIMVGLGMGARTAPSQPMPLRFRWAAERR